MGLVQHETRVCVAIRRKQRRILKCACLSVQTGRVPTSSSEVAPRSARLLLGKRFYQSSERILVKGLHPWLSRLLLDDIGLACNFRRQVVIMSRSDLNKG